MNVERLGRWAARLLEALDTDTTVIGTTVFSTHPDRDKTTWMESFREDIAVWNAIFGIVEMVEEHVRQYGISQMCVQKLEAPIYTLECLPHLADFGESLLEFVRAESAKARPGERLLGSSDVIESVFGKLKHIEGAQAKQGFTGLILSAAAIVGPTTAPVVQNAMDTISMKAVQRWCRDVLGVSVQAQRQSIFSKPQLSGTTPE